MPSPPMSSSQATAQNGIDAHQATTLPVECDVLLQEVGDQHDHAAAHLQPDDHRAQDRHRPPRAQAGRVVPLGLMCSLTRMRAWQPTPARRRPRPGPPPRASQAS